MKVTFLGTGTSHGVPSIDCMMSGYSNCPKGVCAAAHRRSRCSILVENDNFSILVDVSADFRQQALERHITHIEAVLITHPHADHIGGIPDIRSYTRFRELPVYGSGESIDRIKQTFPYIFQPPEIRGGGIPQLAPRVVEATFTLGGFDITPVAVEHGSLRQCLGYRIGEVAYIPDMKKLKPGSFDLLRGVKILILDCLRTSPEHQTHIILPESIELARRIAPEKCYFTHLCHEIHYHRDGGYLDPWMHFAYDGLRFDV
ncbi:MAG: MBL fold metallo-hydrolase [Chitinispirillaceae bacterium]